MTSLAPTPPHDESPSSSPAQSELFQLGIGEEGIALLAEIGVTQATNLSHNNPYVLAAKLEQANQRTGISAYTPTLGTIAEWMRRARAHLETKRA